jgi:hypothetical protein
MRTPCTGEQGFFYFEWVIFLGDMPGMPHAVEVKVELIMRRRPVDGVPG